MPALLARTPEEAEGAAAVVLPGVGAFGACATALARSGLGEVVRDAIATGTPFLGICVGFQLLFEGSDEDLAVPGLGLLPGRVGLLPDGVKRPQMQWNVVSPVAGRPSLMLPASDAERWFYFVHSYAPVPAAEAASFVAGTCDYGGPVVAAFERGPLWATQFHPEKSGTSGLALLERFVALGSARTAVPA